MKLIETINSAALAVVAVPEALREARWMMRELVERDGMPARLQRLIEGAQKKDKRITELETEVRKLTEANHGAAAELNRARADAVSMRLDVERLQSEVVRLSAPVGHGEPAIPEPDPGEGFELCGQSVGLEASVWMGSKLGWSSWKGIEDYRYAQDPHTYAFRRPIAKPEPVIGLTVDSRGESYFLRVNDGREAQKPEPKWLACTAEEARKNPVESQTFAASLLDAGKFDWRNCSGCPCGFSPGFAYRTTATLPLEIAVPKSVWDRAPANARRYTAQTDIGSLEWFLLREKLLDGFRLDAP